jgi:hypothetical protein
MASIKMIDGTSRYVSKPNDIEAIAPDTTQSEKCGGFPTKNSRYKEPDAKACPASKHGQDNEHVLYADVF